MLTAHSLYTLSCVSLQLGLSRVLYKSFLQRKTQVPSIRERPPGRHSGEPGRSVRRSRWVGRLETQKRAKTGKGATAGRTGRRQKPWLEMMGTPGSTGWKDEGPLMEGRWSSCHRAPLLQEDNSRGHLLREEWKHLEPHSRKCPDDDHSSTQNSTVKTG